MEKPESVKLAQWLYDAHKKAIPLYDSQGKFRGMVRPQIGDAKPITVEKSLDIMQQCIDEIMAAGFECHL